MEYGPPGNLFDDRRKGKKGNTVYTIKRSSGDLRQITQQRLRRDQNGEFPQAREAQWAHDCMGHK